MNLKNMPIILNYKAYVFVRDTNLIAGSSRAWISSFAKLPVFPLHVNTRMLRSAHSRQPKLFSRFGIPDPSEPEKSSRMAIFMIDD